MIMGKAVGLGFFATKQQMELIMQWMPSSDQAPADVYFVLR
jgi:hypothetical protein